MGDRVKLRDDLERVLRAWNAYETGRGAPAVIDFDCHPEPGMESPAVGDRLAVHRSLTALRERAESGRNRLVLHRIDAHLAYLEALLGTRRVLTDYVMATQGCPARGWTGEYVGRTGESVRAAVEGLGLPWDATTADALDEYEERIDRRDVPDLIRALAGELETEVRTAADTGAPLDLRVEVVEVDAYWAYWLDGCGSRVRLRVNTARARFTAVQAKQFALHEVLGHGLQCASYSHRCATEDVPWVRLTSVHAPQQVLFEGLAQTLPLVVAGDDERLLLRVRLTHYLELVRSELHLLVNAGASVREAAVHARRRVPFWTDGYIAGALADRSVDPLLRSYLWAYPAGVDWFMALWRDADSGTASRVLRAAYREPLTPDDLCVLWPAGPAIGGPVRSA